MDYLLEQLGADRFQSLVQTLLVSEKRGIQCLPLNMSDGGRDAIQIYRNRANRGFIVFQVKYLENPERVRNPHKWLQTTLRKELPKIKELIPRGALEYCLITNIRGTSQLGKGSIDTVNELLEAELPIPASTWWRDDVCRRIDAAGAVKWSYPEILRALDLIEALYKPGESESRNRRTDAIRAFIATQRDEDEKVRFKQIDLQSDLLGLFIDVPALVEKGADGKDRSLKVQHHIYELSQYERNNSESVLSADHRETIGAAHLLLDELCQTDLPFTVVEGAPGQGKSTLAQYICQIYRLKFLRPDKLRELPPYHIPSNIRIPIKVDLREYAAWISGEDPFSDLNFDVPERNIGNRSLQLEAFLAALIMSASGGSRFEVSDLHAILRESQVLLVLDGLDEVADLDRRGLIIQQISLACRRLQELSPTLQVVVTTRPSAFTGLSEFPRTQFQYLRLVSITRSLITDYAERWTSARGLPPAEARTVGRTLVDRLQQPHIRDLARNPMQLAILLSVIHQRGSSLPDKRTALYELYVEIFIAREAEKSPAVRNNRDLLIDLHGYLAWRLHSLAESRENLGRIDADALKEMLVGYLKAESRNPQLADELFIGAQRVVFLVARVEGTFEFEVQPLREYFAAKFLYETSPYSRAGAERLGTMPDRFDALARNTYWFNVARFFAGFLSKGELSTLVDRVALLASDEKFSCTFYPIALLMRLLSDWVFHQDQHAQRRAVSIVLEDTAFRSLATQVFYSRRIESLALPEGCGNEALVSKALQILPNTSIEQIDLIFSLARLLRENQGQEDTYQSWKRLVDHSTRENLARSLCIGSGLGMLMSAKIDDLPIEAMLESPREFSAYWLDVITACQNQGVEIDDRVASAYVDSILEGTGFGRVILWNRFDHLASLFSLESFYQVLMDSSYVPLRDTIGRFGYSRAEVLDSELPEIYDPQTRGFVELYLSHLDKPVSVWQEDIALWSEIVEEARRIWGDRRAINQLALFTAFVPGLVVSSTDASNIFASHLGLCERVRIARKRAGNAAWWKRQFRSSNSPEDEVFLGSLFALIAGPTVIKSLRAEFSAMISGMDSEKLSETRNSIQTVFQVVSLGTGQGSRYRSFDFESWISDFSEEAVVVLGAALDDTSKRRMYETYFDGSVPRTGAAANFALNAIISLLHINEDQNYASRLWETAISIMHQHPGESVVGVPVHDDGKLSMPVEIAQDVLKDHGLPLWVHSVALQSCEAVFFSAARSLEEIAVSDEWFSRDPNGN